MRNTFTIIILILILYTVFEEKKQIIFGESQNQEISKNEEINNEVKKEEIVEKKEKLGKEGKNSYQYEPQNFAERVITNAVTNYIKSPSGTELAKSLLTPKDTDLRANSLSFPTFGFNGISRKYEIQTVVDTKEKKSICGQKIKAHYIIESLEKKPIESKTLEYVIGKGNFEELNILADKAPLHSIISGNYFTNEPKNDAFNAKHKKIYVSIREHLTHNDLDFSKIKIFDEYVTTTAPVLCFDNAEFKYKISKINGDLIKNGFLKFQIGDYSYPIALSYVLDHMPLLGSRTIILPGKYLLSDNKNFIFNSKGNDFVIFEIEKADLIERNRIVQ